MLEHRYDAPEKLCFGGEPRRRRARRARKGPRAERFTLLRVDGVRIVSLVASFAETMAAEGPVEWVDCVG